MNCSNVQSALWLGLATPDMEDHIRSCTICQKEQRELEVITSRLSSMDVPNPTKSLVPDRSVIQKAVRRRHSIVWRRALFAGLGVAVMAIAVTGITLFPRLEHAGSTTPASTNALAGNPAHAESPSGGSNALAVVSPTAPHPEQCQIVQQFFLKQSTAGLKDIQHITIKGFYPDPSSDPNIVTGRVDADIQLNPGANSPYHAGANSFYVLITKQGGVWTTVNVASSPFTNANTPEYYKGFDQAKVLIMGTIVKAPEMETVTENGATAATLVRMTVKIDANVAKDSTGQLQSGSTLNVEFNNAKVTPTMNISALKPGASVALYVAQADPANNAGMTVWYSRLDSVFYLDNGKFHELNGGAPVADINPTPAELTKH